MVRLGVVLVLAVATMAGCGGGDQKPDAPSATAAPTQRDARAACERAGEQTRREHPDAYVAACNHGAGSLAGP